MLRLMEITNETREQLRAAPAKENDWLLAVAEARSRAAKERQRRADAEQRKGRGLLRRG